jgi:hypothetical protein
MRVKKIMVFVLGLLCLQLGFAGSAVAESGRQTFVLSQLPGEDQIRVTAAGPIRGVGIDVVVNEVEDEETGIITAEDRFQFPEGNLSLRSRITLTSEFSVDPRSCVGRAGGAITYEVTGGTGRYAGATGSGTGTFRIVSVLGRSPDGSCSEQQDDEVAHIFIVRLAGVATVPDGASV